MSLFPHKSSANGFGPFDVLKRALAGVPAVKYALGIAGIGAAVAIVKTFFTDWVIAVFGIVIMMILMAVLFVFAKLTSVASRDLRLAMLTFMWSSLVLTISTAAFLFSSVFFNWPINLRGVITSGHTVVSDPSHPETKMNVNQSSGGSDLVDKQNRLAGPSYLRGKIVDVNDKPIPDALIELSDLPGKYFTTSTDGGFYIENIPIKQGERSRVYVSKKGYRNRNEYVTLPGPIRIRLER